MISKTNPLKCIDFIETFVHSLGFTFSVLHFRINSLSLFLSLSLSVSLCLSLSLKSVCCFPVLENEYVVPIILLAIKFLAWN